MALWAVLRGILQWQHNVSEENITYIFRIQKLAEKESSIRGKQTSLGYFRMLFKLHRL
jgi:hypothetical protein